MKQPTDPVLTGDPTTLISYLAARIGHTYTTEDHAAVVAHVAEVERLAQGVIAMREREQAHYHIAKYDDGKLLDECGICGLDLRDPVHTRALLNSHRIPPTVERRVRETFGIDVPGSEDAV